MLHLGWSFLFTLCSSYRKRRRTKRRKLFGTNKRLFFSLRSSARQELQECNSERLSSIGCSVKSLQRHRREEFKFIVTWSYAFPKNDWVFDPSPERASMGWLEECRVLTGVPLSSKATLVPSELPSQLIKTWLQSSASMRGRVLEWTLRSMSSSKLHWLDLPFRPETKPTLAESCSFRNSEPSTRCPFGAGLQRGRRREVFVTKTIWKAEDRVLTALLNSGWERDDRGKSRPIKHKLGVILYISAAKQIPQKGQKQQWVSSSLIYFPFPFCGTKPQARSFLLEKKILKYKSQGQFIYLFFWKAISRDTTLEVPETVGILSSHFTYDEEKQNTSHKTCMYSSTTCYHTITSNAFTMFECQLKQKTVLFDASLSSTESDS